MRRVLVALGAGFVALAAPAVVAAHTLNTTYESQLPLAVYLAGAASAVALSFAFVLLRDLRANPPPDDAPRRTIPRPLGLALRAIGLVAWAWIIAQGIAGGNSDADVGSLFLWVYGWVGLALVSAFIGPAWHWLDPFSTLYDLGAGALRLVGLRGWEATPYPARLGRWPAVAGFVFFVWVELVLRQGIGRTLFIVVCGYTALTLAMMAQFGRDTWRANGETFTVWYRLLNRIAPWGLADEEGHVVRRGFASGLLVGGWTVADVTLIAAATGSILFDGLSQTTTWYQLFGFPPAPALTIQLAIFLGVIIVAALAVSRLVGVDATGAGLLPIAVGYLIAHYLTYLLIDGQRIVVAISDPFQKGWDLFGTAFYVPTGAFLAPGLVWTIQLAAVVAGHMLGAWAGHVTAARHVVVDLRLRQVPLAVVMVTLTTVTLWSLGQAIVKQPTQSVVGPNSAVVAPTR